VELDFGDLSSEGSVGYARRQLTKLGDTMHTLPTTMIVLLAPFAPLSSKRLWPHVQLLLLFPSKSRLGDLVAVPDGVVELLERLEAMCPGEHHCHLHSSVIHRRIFSWSGCEAEARSIAAQVRTTMVLYDNAAIPLQS